MSAQVGQPASIGAGPWAGRRRALAGIAAAAIAAAAGAGTAGRATGSERRDERLAMVAEVRRMAREVARSDRVPEPSTRVLDALARVPRHRFVPPGRRADAYRNRPLPIGYGQTISQPYIVALMTELLEPEPGRRILEVGTGSGYQAAVLAELGARVWTIEIIEPLARAAGERLRSLGYAGVHTRLGDGYYGWPEHAPFDGIVVTAAASHVPPPLVAQLRPGAPLVIPVGGRFTVQQLVVVRRRPDGSLETRRVLPVRFVPLTGAH